MFLVCGEALFDLFAATEPGSSAIRFDGRIGGSPFNVAIGMARMGSASALFTGISTDMMGEKLMRALEREGVSTQYLLRTGRRTTLSVVGLDEAGVPSYAFYGIGSADCSVTEADLPVLGPAITGLHLGSYSIAVDPVASALSALVSREAGRFISLDPNIRPTVEPRMEIWRDRVDALRRKAALVKVSAEDLGMMYPGGDPLEIARSWALDGPALVVVTRGGEDVIGLRGDRQHRVTPPAVAVVDTVGAGDAFQASMLASLAGDGLLSRDALSQIESGHLEAILTRAATAASLTCSRRGADLPHAGDISQS